MIIEIIKLLLRVLYLKTLLSLLPFIEKPLEELERVNSEKEAAFETYSFPMVDEVPTDDEEEV